MTDEQARRLKTLQGHELHEAGSSEDHLEIIHERALEGYSRLILGDWNLEYFESDAPLFLRQSQGDLILYQSDIDTIQRLLNTARQIMQGEA